MSVDLPAVRMSNSCGIIFKYSDVVSWLIASQQISEIVKIIYDDDQLN
jgi:hypothetical protein